MLSGFKVIKKGNDCVSALVKRFPGLPSFIIDCKVHVVSKRIFQCQGWEIEVV